MIEFTLTVNVSDEHLGQVADRIYQIARRCEGQPRQIQGGVYQFTVPSGRAAEVRETIQTMTENIDIQERIL